MDASRFEYLPELSDLLELKYPWELEACSALISPEECSRVSPLHSEQPRGAIWRGADPAGTCKVLVTNINLFFDNLQPLALTQVYCFHVQSIS